MVEPLLGFPDYKEDVGGRYSVSLFYSMISKVSFQKGREQTVEMRIPAILKEGIFQDSFKNHLKLVGHGKAVFPGDDLHILTPEKIVKM